MPLSGVSDFDAALSYAGEAVEQTMDSLLPAIDGPEARLPEAMRYAAFGPGSRLRPFLVLASATLFSVARSAAFRVAAAGEFAHACSTIHDDLPPIDRDERRHHRPSCRSHFGAATAILARDALQSLAFEVLAQPATHGDPAVRCLLTAGLAQAIGAHGTAGGQMLHLAAADQALENAAIIRLQRLKTGALFAFACTAGAILAKASDPMRHALQAYAHDLGLAWQITNDLLEADAEHDPAGNSGALPAAKASFVDVLGRDRARDQANVLARQASRHLESFGAKADLLRRTAQFVVGRRA